MMDEPTGVEEIEVVEETFVVERRGVRRKLEGEFLLLEAAGHGFPEGAVEGVGAGAETGPLEVLQVEMGFQGDEGRRHGDGT